MSGPMKVVQKVNLISDFKYRSLVTYSLKNVEDGLLGDMSLIESGRCFQFDHMICDSLWRFIVMDKELEETSDLIDGVEIFALNQATDANDLFFENSDARHALLKRSVKSRVIFVYMYPPFRQWANLTKKKFMRQIKDILDVVAKPRRVDNRSPENLFRKGTDVLFNEIKKLAGPFSLLKANMYFTDFMKEKAQSIKGDVVHDGTFFKITQIQDLPFRDKHHKYDLYIYIIDKDNLWFKKKKNCEKAANFARASRVFVVTPTKELHCARDIMSDLDTITSALKPLEYRQKGESCFTCVGYPDFCSLTELYSEMGVEVIGPPLEDDAQAIGLAHETGLLNLNDSANSTDSKSLVTLHESIDPCHDSVASVSDLLHDSVDPPFDSVASHSVHHSVASHSVDHSIAFQTVDPLHFVASHSAKFDFRADVLLKPVDYIHVPWVDVLHPMAKVNKAEDFTAKLKALAQVVLDDEMRKILLKDAATVEVSKITKKLRLMNMNVLSNFTGYKLTRRKKLAVEVGFEVRFLNDLGIRVVKNLIRWLNGNFQKLCITPGLDLNDVTDYIYFSDVEVVVDLPCELVAGEDLNDVKSFKNKFEKDIESLISIVGNICGDIISRENIPPMMFHLFEIMRDVESWHDNYDYILCHPSLWTSSKLNDFCQWAKGVLLRLDPGIFSELREEVKKLKFVHDDWIGYVKMALKKLKCECYPLAEIFWSVLCYSLDLQKDDSSHYFSELIGPIFWVRELFSHAAAKGSGMSYDLIADGVLFIFPVYFCEISWLLFSKGYREWFQP